MRSISYFKVVLSVALLAAASASAQTIDFDTTIDPVALTLISKTSADLEYGAAYGTESQAGGSFQSAAAAGVEKSVVASLPGAFDSTLIQSWTTSVLMRFPNLANTPLNPPKDYSSTIRIGFASVQTLGPGVTASKYHSSAPSFYASIKFEWDRTKPQAEYLGLDMAGNTGTTPVAANRLKDLNFSGDEEERWYKLELTVTRNATLANAYDYESRVYDYGYTGVPSENNTPILTQSKVSGFVNTGFSADTTVYSFLQYIGELTVEGAQSQTFVDKYVVQVPEPASVALVGLGGLVLARRRRQAGA